MTDAKKKLIKYIIAGTAVSLAGLLLFILIVIKFCLIGTFNREDGPKDVARTTMYTADDFNALNRRKVEFKSGKNTLKGYVWGNRKNNKLVVISHGLGELSNSYYPLMEYFVNSGYRVLTYDNTGVGESEGLGTKGLSQSAVDLDNALKFVESDGELKDLPVYLFGHSWGGHAVTAVLNFGHANVKAVASVAGYNSNGGAMLEWMQRRLNMGNFAYTLFPFAAFWAMIDAGDNYFVTGVEGINTATVPVIVVQGGNDDTVLNDSIYSHREEITNQNVEYYFVENGTHTNVLISDSEETEKYREKVQKEYEELEEKYHGKIPADVENEFIGTIDKGLYNRANKETLDEVCRFFAGA